MKGIIILVGLVIIGGIGFEVAKFTNTETITITVTDKERVVTGKGDDISSKYLIYTDKGTFENTDTFIKFKFNSSDLYGKLKKDSTYTVETYGFRVPFLSMYKNIVKIVK